MINLSYTNVRLMDQNNRPILPPIKPLILYAAMMLSCSFVWGQERIAEQYVELGIKQNLILKTEIQEYQKQVAALKEAKSLFLPQLSFNANYTVAKGGRALEFPIGDLFNPVNQTLNSLSGENSFPTDLENVNEQFLPDNFQETKLRVVQPLLNSDIYFNHKAQQSMISVQAARKDAYQQELSRDIRMSYYQYLQTEAVMDVYEETSDLLYEILRVNRKLVENEKATYDVIYSAEFEIKKLDEDIARARKDQQVAKAYLNFLVNEPLEKMVPIDSALIIPSMIWKLDSLESNATSKRMELQEIAYSQEANQQNVKLQKNLILPKVNAVMDLGFQGFGYNFGDDQAYWLTQISLTWDIFTGFRNKSRREQAEITQYQLSTREQALTQQIQLQVREAFYKVKAASSAIASAESGLKSAKDIFRITQKKYKEDQASLLELLDSRTRFTQSQLTLVINTYDYLAKLAELKWASAL